MGEEKKEEPSVPKNDAAKKNPTPPIPEVEEPKPTPKEPEEEFNLDEDEDEEQQAEADNVKANDDEDKDAYAELGEAAKLIMKSTMDFFNSLERAKENIKENDALRETFSNKFDAIVDKIKDLVGYPQETKALDEGSEEVEEEEQDQDLEASKDNDEDEYAELGGGAQAIMQGMTRFMDSLEQAKENLQDNDFLNNMVDDFKQDIKEQII